MQTLDYIASLWLPNILEAVSTKVIFITYLHLLFT